MSKKKRPTDTDKKQGLYNRYKITKANGKPCDLNAEYFVLRLDYHKGQDISHVQACRAAIRLYASLIEPHLPRLARDLEARYGV